MGTLPRLHGSWTVARQIPGQRRAPWLDPERIAALRDRRVRSVVGYAAAHVPHYRDAFRAEGLDPREIRTADDLARLPLVTKGDVQRDPARFVAETRSGREAIVFRTSGSTGVPLAIAHDRRSMLDNIPHSERERVVETALCGKRVRYRVVVLGPPDQSASKRVQAFYADATLRPVRPDLQHLSVAEPVERSVVELNRRRPDVIRGYGSYLEALFRRIDARGLPFEPPRVVVVAGDGITREGKALIEERFGIPVVERYAAVEAFKIAFTCEERAAYHVHDDLCHVRLADGEIVISNLVNRGTVLLNYRLGDLGRPVEGRCACGRGLSLLAGIEGRVSAVLELAGGALVHPIAVWSALRDEAGILQFQLVQHEPTTFELRLATIDAPTFDRVAAAALPRLCALLDGATVEATRHDELGGGAGGKFPTVVPLPDPA